MHAAVAVFEMPEPEGESLAYLDGIVARVSQEQGFVAGYWRHDGEKACNTLVFDSAEAAGLSPAVVTVAKVVAHATRPA